MSDYDNDGWPPSAAARGRTAGQGRLLNFDLRGSSKRHPAGLKEFAGRFGAKPRWHFLTGKKESVEFILQKLGQFVDDKENHKNVVLIGNEPSGLWKKAFGLAPPADLIKIVDSVLKDQGPEEGSGGR